MRPIFALIAFTIAAPVFAQDVGTPPATNSAPQNRPLTQHVFVFPPKDSGAGLLRPDKSHSQSGQPVAFAFTIANSTKDAVPYDYPTAQQFDVTVSDAQGRQIWDWARGQVFAQAITRVSLRPGQTKTYRAVWNGRDAQGRPAAPGLYTARARMTSSNRPGVTGGFLVDPDTDPNNIGFPTRSPADNGAVRQFSVNPPITAHATFTIGVPRSPDAK